jgi:squalene synthase HpnC
MAFRLNYDQINAQFSELLAKTHYENFPVASILLPKKARKDIFHVYTFARISDDIADDPNRDSEEKLQLLNTLEDHLTNDDDSNQLIKLILPVIQRWNLDKTYFLDLLSAFKQDAVKSTYGTFDEVLDYCQRSANPVGRLMLQFFNQDNEIHNHLSDKICTGLQLINFWQDLSVDKAMNRFYVPQDILDAHGLSRNEFYQDRSDQRHEALITELIERTEAIYLDGKPLISKLKGRLKYEIFFIWHSANRVLKKSKKLGAHLLLTRPSN